MPRTAAGRQLPPNGSLLIRAEGRGGAAGRRQRRQAAVAAAGAAALATMTASSVAACSMGSARPAPGAAPLATTAARPVPPAMTGRLRPPRGRRGGLGSGGAGGVVRRGRPASRSENAQHTSVQCRRIARSDADLEVGPAELAFDLLVALLDPVAQPVQAHDLGQVGRLGAARWRVGAGWSADTRCCARAGVPGSVVATTSRSGRSGPQPPSWASAAHQVSVWPSRKRRVDPPPPARLGGAAPAEVAGRLDRGVGLRRPAPRCPCGA